MLNRRARGCAPHSAARSRTYLPLLAVAAFLITSILIWHGVNRHVPIWDGANFVANALGIAEAFDRSLLEGLHGLYSARGWRPIAFPAFATPFFLAAGGKIIPGVALTLCGAAVLIAIYTYRLMREFLAPWAAGLGTLFIVTLPWIGRYTTTFMSEILWLGATAGWLHHLTVGFRRQSGRDFLLAGLWLGVMAAVRPIETVLICALPVACSLLVGQMQRMLTWGDIALLIVQGVAVAAAAWLLGVPPSGRPAWRFALPFESIAAAAALLVFFGSVVIRGRHIFVARPLMGSVTGGLLIALLWFLPHFQLLYSWAYETSFGPLAKITDQRFAGQSIITIFAATAEQYSPKLLVVAAAIAAIGLAPFTAQAIRQWPGDSRRLLALALLMFPVGLVLLALTGTSDARRLMPAFLAVFIAIAVVALAPYGRFRRTRILAIATLTSIQAALTISNNLGIASPLTLRAQAEIGWLRQPEKDPDPNVPVAEGLMLLLRRGYVAVQTHCYRAPAARCSERGIGWFDPSAIGTLLAERHSPVRVHFTGAPIDFSLEDDILRRLHAEGFDHVLIDELPLHPNLNINDPYVANTEGFVRLLRSPLPARMSKVGRIEYSGRTLHLIAID